MSSSTVLLLSFCISSMETFELIASKMPAVTALSTSTNNNSVHTFSSNVPPTNELTTSFLSMDDDCAVEQQRIGQDGAVQHFVTEKDQSALLFDAAEVNQAAAIVKERIVQNKQGWASSVRQELIETVDLYVKLANEKQGSPWKSSLSFLEELDRRISLKATRIAVEKQGSQGIRLSHQEVNQAVKSVQASVLEEFPFPDIQEDLKKTIAVYSKLAHQKLCAPWKSSLSFRDELARRIFLKANRLAKDAKVNRPFLDWIDSAVVLVEARICLAFPNPTVQQKALKLVQRYANLTKEQGHAPWKANFETFQDDLYHRVCDRIRLSACLDENDDDSFSPSSSPVTKKRKISYNTNEIDRAASVVEAKIQKDFLGDFSLQVKAIEIMHGYVQQTKANGRAPWKAAASSKTFEDELYRRVYMQALEQVNLFSNALNNGQQTAPIALCHHHICETCGVVRPQVHGQHCAHQSMTSEMEEGELVEELSSPEEWQIVQSEVGQSVESSPPPPSSSPSKRFDFPILTPIYSCEV